MGLQQLAGGSTGTGCSLLRFDLTSPKNEASCNDLSFFLRQVLPSNNDFTSDGAQFLRKETG